MGFEVEYENGDDYRLRIIGKIPLETARKDVCYDTGEPFDPDSDDFSEWMIAHALAQYNIGDNVSSEDFNTKLHEARTQQILDDMVESGLIVMSWDPETGEPVYSISELGKTEIEKRRKE